MSRIVLVTQGSLGDLHPYLALAVELAARGHAPVLATHESYRERIERAGIEFRPVRPDMGDLGEPREVLRRAMNLQTGSRYVLEEFVLDWLEESCADLLPACEGADLVVSHVLTLTAVLVAEKLRIPRLHTVLQPLAMFSAHDPPVLPQLPFSESAVHWGPLAWRGIYALLGATSRPWFAPVHRLRARLGLPRATAHPLLGMGGPLGTVALFSRELASPQPDWPPHTTVTGFCVWDRDDQGRGMSEELAAFLAAGERPVVFTLGSAAVFDARDFYDVAARAVRRLGLRAVMLTGPDGMNALAERGSDGAIVTAEYAPHSELLPRAAATVHAGGIGTTGQALAAGRPMLLMPCSHDQPDNARRCVRLGLARAVPRAQWREERVVRELGALLADGPAHRLAAETGARVRAEGGARAAAEAVEAALERTAHAHAPRGGTQRTR